MLSDRRRNKSVLIKRICKQFFLITFTEKFQHFLKLTQTRFFIGLLFKILFLKKKQTRINFKGPVRIANEGTGWESVNWCTNYTICQLTGRSGRNLTNKRSIIFCKISRLISNKICCVMFCDRII